MLILLVSTNRPPNIYREGDEYGMITSLVNPKYYAICGIIIVYRIFLVFARTSLPRLLTDALPCGKQPTQWGIIKYPEKGITTSHLYPPKLVL